MFGRSVKIELPRKVVFNYLLCSLIVLTWLVMGAVFVAQSVLREHCQNEWFQRLDQASSAVTREYVASGGENLQPLVERLAREHVLRYCAFASNERQYIAHSSRDMVNETREVPTGPTVERGTAQGVRMTIAGQTIREYSIPVSTQKDEVVGLLVMAADEPDVGNILGMAARYTPIALGAPILLLTLGGITLHRLVRPTAAIDSQLRQAAIAPLLSDAELQTVTGGASAIGWNRLIEAYRNSGGKQRLEERLGDAVQALRQGKSDDVLNSLADGVVVTDQDGRITLANHSAGALLSEETEPERLHGSTMESCLQLDSDDATTEMLLDSEFHARQVVHEMKRRRGNTDQILRIARYPIRTSDRSSKAGHVWSLRDITQQKLADAMRDQFLDNATHELRTPLASIKAYAETLAMSDELDVESQKEFCNTINTEATRLARFIDDLLSVSSMEAGSLTLDKQRVELNRVFTEVVGKVKPQMDKKGIHFEAIFPEKYPQLKIDKGKFNVALVNLLGNAAKYTPGGGRVRFEVTVTNQEFRIEVEDTGPGIVEDELPRIFEKFFRSTNSQVQATAGTGLGLSIAYEIVKLHGGDLTVQSTFGEGTTFTATLPLE
jgi:signal transduction histidine kinase